VFRRTRLENGRPVERLPLICRWDEAEKPLPVRTIRTFARSGSQGDDGRAIREAGPEKPPFDFCGHMRRLCADIRQRCPGFDHMDIGRMLFAVTQARNRHPHGLQARVTPLRFREGRLTRQRRGVTYQVQRYLIGSQEILYLVTFCLPRFLDLDFDEKFVTLFHELYHINPAFDGDLRRHGGRYSIHSHSQRRYDEHMARLARQYLAGGADPAVHAFLRLNFAQLQHRHGKVTGVMVPRPKIIPVPARNPAKEEMEGSERS
jgi:hypothetical protein